MPVTFDTLREKKLLAGWGARLGLHVEGEGMFLKGLACTDTLPGPRSGLSPAPGSSYLI